MDHFRVLDNDKLGALVGGPGAASGPGEIYLAAGANQDFFVDVVADLCIADGTQLTVTVDVTGNGAGDSSLIVQTVRDGPTCPECPESYVYLPIVVRAP